MALARDTVRRIALSLPDSTQAPHHDMTSFRVAGKIFATMPPEGDRVHIFIGADEVAAYCAEYPGMVEALWWGKKLSGSRVVLEHASRDVVREMLIGAWRAKAPSRARSQFDA
jgi:hypothetical protein